MINKYKNFTKLSLLIISLALFFACTLTSVSAEDNFTDSINSEDSFKNPISNHNLNTKADLKNNSILPRAPGDPEYINSSDVRENGTNNKNITWNDTITIIDTVHCVGLDMGIYGPAHEYLLEGILIDKSTGLPFLVDGKNVTFSYLFKGDSHPDGMIDMIFTFKAPRNLENLTLVVFQRLYRVTNIYYPPQTEPHLCGVHEDINDLNQTVFIHSFPKISTTAKDKVTGGKNLSAGGIITIVDTVKYSNLIVGKTYTIKGTLMDKNTGKWLIVNGKAVVVEYTFVTNQTNGVVDLEFTFDSKGLGERNVVVFEKLFENGNEIATHEDLNDQNQSIFITSEPEESETIDNPETPETPENPDVVNITDNSDTPDTPTPKSAMKETGMPIVALLLILFKYFGFT